MRERSARHHECPRHPHEGVDELAAGQRQVPGVLGWVTTAVAGGARSALRQASRWAGAALLACAACANRPEPAKVAAPPARGPRVWEYEVEADHHAEQLRVFAQLPPG